MKWPHLMMATAALATMLGCGGSSKKEVKTAPPERRALAKPEPPPRPREDDIKLEGELGTLEQEAVESVFRPRLGEITGCYQEGVARHHYLGGAFELKVRVKPDGEVKSIAAVAPLGNYVVEKCIITHVGALRFPAPRGNAEAEFNYTWQFRARAPLKEWGTSDVGASFASAKHKADLVACEKLIAGVTPPGLRVTFYVTAGGKVASVGVGGDAAVDDKFASCVVGKIATWRFADPLGTVARATYQF